MLNGDGSPRSVDCERPMSPQNFDSRKLFSVGEVAPVGRFTAEIIGQATDAEIRVVVRDEKCDLHVRIEFMGPTPR